MTTFDEQFETDAEEAMKLTRKFFVVELNFSDDSVRQLEEQFDAIDYALSGGMSHENIQLLKRVWGSYLGETIRRRYGGQWNLVSNDEGEEVPALTHQGKLLFPHQQVSRRLTDGDQHSIWEYYQNLCNSK